MPDVDKNLLAETLQLGDKFDMALARLASGPDLDLRMFFTMAHGYITKKIGKHINLFNNPNALMRLNKAFATTYLSAVAGSPHHDWQRAFRVCQAEVKAMQSGFVGLLFLGPVVAESCAACMANVHIMRDLRDALTAIRDVDPQDYGNILVFVMEGNMRKCSCAGRHWVRLR
jgi:hypothetical protein